MNSRNDQLDLFSTPEEKLSKLDIDAQFLTPSEIMLLCDHPTVLLGQLKDSIGKITLPEYQNVVNIIKYLLDRNRKGRDVMDSLTRCRKCSYYPFIVNSKCSGHCPKCDTIHIRP